MATLPSLTRRMDTAFTTTWYEMQAKATDNILDSNVISAALRAKGCFKPQKGGDSIERTIRYGTKTAIAVAKGDTLPTGEDELETAAFWDWKYIAVHVQRSFQDDQKNTAARDAMDSKYESCLIAAVDTTTGGLPLRAARDPYSLFNILPGTSGTYYNYTESGSTTADYTYGGIKTSSVNTWWQGKYTTATNPCTMNLKDQLRTLYNTACGGSNDRPDLGITTQTVFEAFEDVCESEIQRVSQDSGKTGRRLAQLGYDVLYYKGAEMVWTPASAWPTGVTLLLCTRYIDVVYDPGAWFAMTPWAYVQNGLERICRIVSTFTGPICYQLRRQARLGAYTT
jgi:hypothetical protein